MRINTELVQSNVFVLLSSLLIGEQAGEAEKRAEVATAEPVQFRIDHRFNRTSRLSFFLFAYNAAVKSDAGGGPDLAAQEEVFRDGQQIISTPQRPILIDPKPDLARIPYAGSFPLKHSAQDDTYCK
ncbi:MAG: hypothetical protein ABR501_00505 [Pyrinomonadaceae bacterium]